MNMSDYIHIVSPGAPAGPLLFVFHGTGGDENQLVGLGREIVPDATIVSPRGDVSEFGSARFFRRTGEGVYDMDDLARAVKKMSAFVEANIAERKPARVLGLGYSNGANILAATMFAKPELFEEVALFHPLIPFAPELGGSLAGRKVLITAGRHDPICPPQMTNRLDAYLRAAGSDVTLDWHAGGHELRPNEIEAARLFFAQSGEEH
ncbi:MAG: alpha/beta hydrolase [Rhizobiaceae bacterium]|nr:alpha/beta hydrolase [Rhizobiaceae bacterium]